MKKKVVLFSLFILPIVAYLFFASGVNSFTKLPVVRESIPELGNWKELNGKPAKLSGKITILGFGGENLIENRGNLFNLNQKVYQRYHEFRDLQFVFVCPIGTEKDAEYILGQFKQITNIAQYHFVFAPKQEIIDYQNSMGLRGKLDQFGGTPYVYIIDKNRNLRGRNDAEEYREGYSTFHLSELSNEMLDDFKIVLYEYRAAFKRNNNAEKKL